MARESKLAFLSPREKGWQSRDMAAKSYAVVVHGVVMHEELDTHHKMPRQHKQSAPRAGEGPPVGAARLGRVPQHAPPGDYFIQ